MTLMDGPDPAPRNCPLCGSTDLRFYYRDGIVVRYDCLNCQAMTPDEFAAMLSPGARRT